MNKTVAGTDIFIRSPVIWDGLDRFCVVTIHKRVHNQCTVGNSNCFAGATLKLRIKICKVVIVFGVS